MKPSLIDTDILSYFLKGDDKVFIKFQEYFQHHKSINISIITYYEILSGLTFKHATKQLETFENFCSEATVLNITQNSVKASAEIYAAQREKGEAIDDIDILIAGIAISHDLILATNNVRHFDKIETLKVDNWSE